MLRILIALFFVSCSIEAAAGSPVEQLKQFIASAKSFRADFTQVTFGESGSRSRESKGVFYLQRPGRFRWDYTVPFRQEIVSDGKKVWFYDEDLEQVTVKVVDNALGSTPAMLLSGELGLEENFDLQQQGVDGALAWIRLLPKSEESGFQYILIGMEANRLGGMELKDNFGQLTRIYFSNLQTNVALAPSLFEFTPPPGVDVLGE